MLLLLVCLPFPPSCFPLPPPSFFLFFPSSSFFHHHLSFNNILLFFYFTLFYFSLPLQNYYKFCSSLSISIVLSLSGSLTDSTYSISLLFYFLRETSHNSLVNFTSLCVSQPRSFYQNHNNTVNQRDFFVAFVVVLTLPPLILSLLILSLGT